MIIDGMLSEIGVGEWNDGIAIERDDRQMITITGLTRADLRLAGRMLYHRITLRIDSRDDRLQAAEDQPAPKPATNYDEATGIKKTGEI